MSASEDNSGADIEPTSNVNPMPAQVNDLLTGIQSALNRTCDAIMGKMKDLEQRVQEMEDNLKDLVEQTDEASKTPAPGVTQNDSAQSLSPSQSQQTSNTSQPDAKQDELL